LDNHDKQIALGERAFLALEYLGPKFEQIEKDLFELLAETNMHDDTTKNELLRSVKNLRRLRQLVNQDIANADFARDMVRRSLKDRAKNAIGW
jgi:hypothetical protein